METTDDADPPQLVVTGEVSGVEGTAVAVPLWAGLSDADGTESLSVQITGVPDFATLSAGQKQFDGSWIISTTDTAINLNNLTLASQDDATFTLVWSAIADATNGTSSTASASTTVTINNIAPTPTIDAISALRVEGSSIDFSGSATDPAGANDTLTFVWDFGDGSPAATGSDVSHTYADNGTFTVTLTVSDEDGGSAVASQTITVDNVAPTAGGDTAITDEEQAVVVSVLGNDSDPAGVNDPLTVADVTQGINGTVTTDGTTVTYTPDGNFNGADSFTYTVSDGDGGTAIATVDVTVNQINDAPIAVPDALATDENTAVSLIVLLNDTDVDADDDPANFSLDTIDSLLVSGLSTGSSLNTATVSESSEGVVEFDLGTDFDELATGESATVTIGYTMSDEEEAISSSTLTIVVNGRNDSPTFVALSSDHGSPQAGSVTIDGSFADVDASDLHSVTIDWGDGTITTSTSTDRRISGNNLYADGGIYTITVSVTDEAGETTSQSTVAYVTGARVQDRVLEVVGTPGDDNVLIGKFFSRLFVTANFLPGWLHTETFKRSDIDRIEVHVGDGDDDVLVLPNVSTSTLLVGGNGDDRLRGGRGDDILLGGAGDDLVIGGRGKDLSIGGTGRDRILGNRGSDLIIGGYTAFDNNTSALLERRGDRASSECCGTVSFVVDAIDPVVGRRPVVHRWRCGAASAVPRGHPRPA